MNLSLSGKIISLIGAAVLGVCLVTLGATYFLLSSTFNELGQKELATDADVVQGQISQMTGKVSAVAALIANNPGVAKAVQDKNSAYLKQFGKDFMKSGGGVFVTFADKKGNALARGHSDKAGDSILKQGNVQKALAGEASAGIEEGTEIKFSLRAGCPVKAGGEIVGSVSTGIDLSSNHFFVDEIKKLSGRSVPSFWGTPESPRPSSRTASGP